MILIVENEPMEAALMCLLLQRQQMLPDGTRIACHNVTSGQDAATWLAQAPRSSVAVVMLDQSLNERENGLLLIPHLRQSPALRPDACILIWSGHDEPEMVHQARAAGAHAFISKQRIGAALGQELVQIVEELWKADARRQSRPWIVLSRSGQSISLR